MSQVPDFQSSERSTWFLLLKRLSDTLGQKFERILFKCCPLSPLPRFRHHDDDDNLIPSECPGAKLHNASLLVEWEVGHVYRTGRLQIIVIIMIVISFLMRMIEVINNMRVIVKLVVGHVYRTKRLRQTLTFS